MGRLLLLAMVICGAVVVGQAWPPGSPAAAAAQAALVISPSSGPCDAAVQITGRDFPASTAVHLDVAGGGGEATLGRLASLTTDASGGFALSVSLGTLGCEGARFIEGLGAGPHEFWIFASRDEPLIVPGQTGGAPLLTRTAYTYTTTAVSPAGAAVAQPQPTLVLSPSSGPCDATVEVTGTAFESGSQIPLDLAGAHSDVAIARLAVATDGSDGKFSVEVTFGPLGCEEAARDTQLDDPGEPKNLGIFAGYDPARMFVLTRAEYHYTTTAVSPEPHALPSTGSGPGSWSVPPAWLVVAAVLAGLGLTLVIASLYRKGHQS